MAKKNIVSIEDRIPKLKQARKKKANRRLLFYLSLFSILILLIIYLQSPLSHVHQIEVIGNTTVENEQIITWSGVTTSDNFWSVNGDKVQEKIAEHEEIEEVKVSKGFYSQVDIEVKEFARVGYVEFSGSYLPILSNGVLLKNNTLKVPSGDAPLLSGFTEGEYLKDLANELHNLPDNISGLISEIHYQPTEENPYKITLFMNDGYEVQGSIRNFSSNMEAYPSIVGQLDPSVEGILHIGVGVYFESFEEEETNPQESGNEEVTISGNTQ